MRFVSCTTHSPARRIDAAAGVRLVPTLNPTPGDDLTLPQGTTITIPITDPAQMSLYPLKGLVTMTFTPVPETPAS